MNKIIPAFSFRFGKKREKKLSLPDSTISFFISKRIFPHILRSVGSFKHESMGGIKYDKDQKQ